jgi:5-formyltetrahydrofolate cyclo-ligase
MYKQDLRKYYLNKRKFYTAAQIQQASINIKNKLIQHIDLSLLHYVHTYLPITTSGEIDSWLIINHIVCAHPHIKLVVPKIAAQNLEHYILSPTTTLVSNRWGIAEPVHASPCAVEKLDLILVPLLICDQHGHRVGYGKGYYDKFLCQCRTNCIKIGLSLFEPVAAISDIQAHDIKLNYVITPYQMLKFTA